MSRADASTLQTTLPAPAPAVHPASSHRPSLISSPSATTIMSFDGASQGSQRPLEPVEVDDSPIDVGEAGARELAPADRGRGAWEFVVAAWLLECVADRRGILPSLTDESLHGRTFLFGYSYAFATLLVYFQSHEPWSQESVGALSAIGTTQLALMFMLPSVASVPFIPRLSLTYSPARSTVIVTCYRRYPEWVKPATWTGVVLASTSMLIASWANKARYPLLPFRASVTADEGLPLDTGLAAHPAPGSSAGHGQRSAFLAGVDLPQRVVGCAARASFWHRAERCVLLLNRATYDLDLGHCVVSQALVSAGLRSPSFSMPCLRKSASPGCAASWPSSSPPSSRSPISS